MIILRAITLWSTVTTVLAKTLEWLLVWHWLPAFLIAINIAVAIAMGFDKLAAQFKWRRTPEAALLLMGLAGGMPGLLISRKLFKHKTVKGSFAKALYGILGVQIIALAWVASQIWG